MEQVSNRALMGTLIKESFFNANLTEKVDTYGAMGSLTLVISKII